MLPTSGKWNHTPFCEMFFRIKRWPYKKGNYLPKRVKKIWQNLFFFFKKTIIFVALLKNCFIENNVMMIRRLYLNQSYLVNEKCRFQRIGMIIAERNGEVKISVHCIYTQCKVFLSKIFIRPHNCFDAMVWFLCLTPKLYAYEMIRK